MRLHRTPWGRIGQAALRAIVGLAAAGVLGQAPAAAQSSAASYPSKPVTLLIPFGAGGAGDISARLLAAKLEAILGQPIVPLNKPGASGSISTAALVAAEPDGYTVAILNSPALWVAPQILQVAYDPFRDVRIVGGYMLHRFGLIVRADAPWKTFDEWRAYVRRNPGKMRVGLAGKGTFQDVFLYGLEETENVRFSRVHFKSDAQSLTAVLGGHVEAAGTNPAVAIPQVRAGKVRMLLSLDRERWRELPEVPSAGDLGFAFYTYAPWAVGVSARTPEGIRAKLEGALRTALRDPELVAKGAQAFIEFRYIPSTAYDKVVKEEFEKWRSALSQLGLRRK